LLGQKLLDGKTGFADAWNFGPTDESIRTVAEVLDRLGTHWPELSWCVSSQQQPHEANLLYLDSSKTRHRLGWQPIWGMEETLRATADWYQFFYRDGSIISRAQLASYISAAQAEGLEWSNV
jgi:CDP-glucose 4,6-dehydratase